MATDRVQSTRHLTELTLSEPFWLEVARTVCGQLGNPDARLDTPAAVSAELGRIQMLNINEPGLIAATANQVAIRKRREPADA